jgi:mono/diheme cytochrome c family protein
VTRGRSMLALAALALVVAGCGAVHHMGPHAGNPVAGKALFLSTCSACHTLAAAGTSGQVGPNLDYAFGPDRCQGFAQSTIQDVVRGQIAYADSNPETDFPPNSSNAVVGMPAGLLNGQKAKDVAAYVSSVAGITHGPGKHWDCDTGSYAG